MTGESETAYYAPASVPAVHRRLDRTDGFVKVIAGGQTLSLLLRQGLVDADALVDIGNVPELAGITIDDESVSIGSATTYRTLAEHEQSDRAGALGDACSVIGDRQVRTMGTVGGAICHADPALDIVPALRVLGATLRIGSVAGRRTASLGSFLVSHMRTDLGETELLEEIVFDRPGARTGTAYEIHSSVEGGWATVGVASRLTVDEGAITDARVALSAVGDTALRSPAVEAELTGAPLSEGTLADASAVVCDDIDPIDDRAGSAEYKRAIAPTIVERSLRTAARRAGGAL